jgi:hypothetical protein
MVRKTEQAVENITGRKRAEEQLKRTLADLERSNFTLPARGVNQP